MKSLYNKSYYKLRIILTFSLATILLVTVLARVSYVLVKELYLNQISSNVNKTVQLTAGQLDKTYLKFLDNGISTKSTRTYYNTFFTESNFSNLYSEFFILDNFLKIVIHSDSNKKLNNSEPRLLLNQKEIFELNKSESTVSLPFKGNDNEWYLWGFYRLSEKHWLAVKESAVNFEKVEQLSTTLWYFGFAGILLSIILGIIVSNSITKPIRKLVSFSDEIGLGNLRSKVPKKIKGELKILTSAMDRMRTNILNNQKEKEKILAQIAHEIRNPLGGIELLTNLISESHSDKTKNEEYTNRILNEISELKNLISSYLDYSKPTMPLPENILLTELIEEVILIFNKEIEQKRIFIKTDFQLENISFDRTHLKNVLVNLIKNSIEATNSNGRIYIETYFKNNNSIISISDNGIGIKKEDLNKIFEPFYTTKPEGTGLGLAACKKYCEDNFASLALQEQKIGSKFLISKEK